MGAVQIAIVGGGFSGVLTALNVLDAPGSDARVYLIEQADRFGVGVAYGARQADHLLNVRAMNMSADPDHPEDFSSWLAHRRKAPPDPFAFASRAEYGAYIQARLRAVAQTGAGAERLDLIHDAAVALRPRGDGFEVTLALGRKINVDAVVLATGNSPPARAVLPDPAIARGPRYVGDPWAQDALGLVGPDEPLLLLGTGLTMVDLMASLESRGHFGPVLALSRRGLSPHRHAPTEVAAPWRRKAGDSLSLSLRAFRRAASDSGDWRSLFDTLRPEIQTLWQAMALAERRRFLRHLRPWWDIHRHRLAPAHADRLDGWREGRLRIEAGRLTALTENAGGLTANWRPRGTRVIRRDDVARVINCSGPDGNPRESRSALILSMLAAGLIRPDRLGLGMDTAEDGRLIDAHGGAHARLFAIGPPARGALWEITAVPDIRIAARRLGRQLAGADFAQEPEMSSGRG